MYLGIVRIRYFYKRVAPRLGLKFRLHSSAIHIALRWTGVIARIPFLSPVAFDGLERKSDPYGFNDLLSSASLLLRVLALNFSHFSCPFAF